jgi:O-antigen ligase
MRQAARTAVVPAYILLCIVLGGSIQGYWGVATLQLLAVAIIGWSLLASARLRLSPAAKALLAIAGLTLGLIAIQLVPLPPGMWTALPGREPIAEGYRLLGLGLPWLPISLTPHETIDTVLTLLPPLAVAIAMLVAGAYRASWLVIAVLLGTFAAVLLGALQVGSADPYTSPWYLYRRTNYGFATGFFANTNHMATLLVISVPLLFALTGELRDQASNQRAGSAVLLLAVSGILVLLVGIYLNGSLAVLLLGLPVLAISATMLAPKGVRLRGAVIAVALLSVAAILAGYLTPLQDMLPASDSTSVNSRLTMWSRTMAAIGDHGLLGSGIGSFVQVYPHYEDFAATTLTVVNHAHNDYLEIALEAGIPGLLLLAALLLWWGSRAVPLWRSPATDRYALAASIASGAMLVHSLVDYPLRTAALSSIMAACLALMAQPRLRQRGETDDLWPTTRHVSV